MKRTIKALIIIIAIVVVALAAHIVTKSSVTSIYSTSDFELVSENQQYYIVLDNRKLKVKGNMVERIDFIPEYYYEIIYSHGYFNDKGGKVERIELVGQTEG